MRRLEINYLLWKNNLVQDICEFILNYMDCCVYWLGGFPVVFDKITVVDDIAVFDKIPEYHEFEILQIMNKQFNWQRKIINQYHNINKSFHQSLNINDLEIVFKDLVIYHQGHHYKRYEYFMMKIEIRIKKHHGLHQEHLMYYRSLKPNQKGRWVNNYK